MKTLTRLFRALLIIPMSLLELALWVFCCALTIISFKAANKLIAFCYKYLPNKDWYFPAKNQVKK